MVPIYRPADGFAVDDRGREHAWWRKRGDPRMVHRAVRMLRGRGRMYVHIMQT